MELPEKCKEKIIKLYPIKGKEVIENSEKVIEYVIEKYKLNNVKIIDNMSYNIIVDAYSDEFKNVIVKIGTNNEYIKREIEFYNIYNKNNNICKVYDANTERNYLILKKASTNLKLDDMELFTDRLKIYKNIFNSLNQKQTSKTSLPKYYDIFEESATNCKEQFLQEKINKSRKFLNEIQSLHQEEYVLHGDIHHWNIILDDDKWKLIDPARLYCL